MSITARADILYDLGRDEEAIRDFKRAIQLPDEDKSDGHLICQEFDYEKIAEMLHDLGRHKEAEEASRLAKDNRYGGLALMRRVDRRTPSWEKGPRSTGTIYGGPVSQEPSIYEGRPFQGTVYHRGPLGPDGQPFRRGPTGPDGQPFRRG